MTLKRKLTIKSHETYYRNILFRSKMEVRWAVLFDSLKIKWNYEPYIYNVPVSDIFPNGTRYVPDFLLSSGTMVEVKPTDPSGEEIAKALAVLATRKKPFAFVIGNPLEGKEIILLSYSETGKLKREALTLKRFLKVTQLEIQFALRLNSTLIFKRIRNNSERGKK